MIFTVVWGLWCDIFPIKVCKVNRPTYQDIKKNLTQCTRRNVAHSWYGLALFIGELTKIQSEQLLKRDKHSVHSDFCVAPIFTMSRYGPLRRCQPNFMDFTRDFTHRFYARFRDFQRSGCTLLELDNFYKNLRQKLASLGCLTSTSLQRDSYETSRSQ